MLKRKKKFLFLGLVTAMVLTVTGCGSNSDGEDTGTETSGRDRLVVAQNAEAATLDLHGGNDNSSSLVNAQIFETLVTQDENMEIQPGLAVDWREIDELTYEFDLKQDVYFHNGEKFTAEDVAFTFRRASKSPSVAAIVGQIDPESIEIIDDYTIRIGTKEPFAPLLAHLAHTASGIMNEKAVEEAGEDVGQNPVGTGPFQFVEWQAGDYVLLERFDNYHGAIPAYKELMIRPILDPSNRLIELETGGVDIAITIPGAERRRIEADPEMQLVYDENFSTQYVGFNLNKEPFDDVRVRQAINYAIDVESILEFVLEDIGEVTQGPISSNVFGAHQTGPIYEYNLERARELMIEAGLEDGFKTELWTVNNAPNADIAVAVSNQLAEINIEAEIKQIEWATYLGAISENDHEMFIVAWASVTGDADYGLYPVFHSSVGPSGGNRVYFANDRVDELLDSARATTDPEERLAYYAEAQEIIVEEAPWAFLVTGEGSAGLRGDVRGFKLNPAGHHRFANVYFGTDDDSVADDLSDDSEVDADDSESDES